MQKTVDVAFSAGHATGVSRRFAGTLGKPETAPGGGVRVPARLTRPGVFSYRWPDGRVTRDYRSPEVVTDASCLSTLASAPLTIDHPKANGVGVKVTAENWRALSVGHVEAPIILDDGWIGGSVVVADSATLQAIDRGEILEVSCGFRALYDDTPGLTPEGQPYDRKVLSMEYNHVALLPYGTPARVPGAALCLDADAEQILEEVEDAASDVTSKDAESKKDDPLAGGDSSVQPGDSPVTEAQVATMLAQAVAPLNETIAALTKALADVAAKATTPKAPEPEEEPMPQDPNAPPPAEGEEVPPPDEAAEKTLPEGEAPPLVEEEGPEAKSKGKNPFPVGAATAKPKGKNPFPVEDSVGLLERLAAEKARADALEALLVQAQVDILGKVKERRMVEDAAQALGLPVVDDTRTLKLAVVRKSLPDFATDADDLALDAHFSAVHRVSQTQLAARAFGEAATKTTAPKVESDAYGKFLDTERARGPR